MREVSMKFLTALLVFTLCNVTYAQTVTPAFVPTTTTTVTEPTILVPTTTTTVTEPTILVPMPDPIGNIPQAPRLTDDQCAGLRAGIDAYGSAIEICEENILANSEDLLAKNLEVVNAREAYRAASAAGADFMTLMAMMTNIMTLEMERVVLSTERTMLLAQKAMLQMQQDSLLQQLIAGGCIGR